MLSSKIEKENNIPIITIDHKKNKTKIEKIKSIS